MVEKLAELGVKLKWERVLEFAGDGAVGRPHIARTMIEMGYVASMSEAFDKYLGRGSLVYAEREKFSPLDAINLIHSVNGLAVLAHPSWVDNLEAQLPSLVEAGLAGMEVHYSSYSSKLIMELELWIGESNFFLRLWMQQVGHRLVYMKWRRPPE